MRPKLAIAAVLLVCTACVGPRKVHSSTTATAQGAARLWLEAAASGNDARVAELSTGDFRDKAAGTASQIREKLTSVENVRWGGSGKEGGDYSWTATGPGGVVFFKVHALSANEFRVSDVQPSW